MNTLHQRTELESTLQNMPAQLDVPERHPHSRPYHKPVLTHLGSIRDLTKAGFSGSPETITQLPSRRTL
jgi:hypothetical protein